MFALGELNFKVCGSQTNNHCPIKMLNYVNVLDRVTCLCILSMHFNYFDVVNQTESSEDCIIFKNKMFKLKRLHEYY